MLEIQNLSKHYRGIPSIQNIRTQRHRVYLAMYAGLGAALIAASAVVIGVEPNHVSVAFSAQRFSSSQPTSPCTISTTKSSQGRQTKIASTRNQHPS